MFYPKSFDDTAVSAILNRRASDQEQVHSLKDKAFVAAAQDLMRVYSE